jgi:hemerythrin-like domain-containing protein
MRQQEKKKPLKRHPALVPLSQDHHFGLLLGWKISQGTQKSVESQRIAAYVLYFFEEHLQKHFQEEEKYVFSLLDSKDDMRKDAMKQHVDLLELKKELERNEENRLPLLEQIGTSLTAHIRFEERELFPYMQQKLAQQELLSLQEKIEAVHQREEEQWTDKFWLKE